MSENVRTEFVDVELQQPNKVLCYGPLVEKVLPLLEVDGAFLNSIHIHTYKLYGLLIETIALNLHSFGFRPA